MRVPATEEPIWYGREYTCSSLLRYVSVHRVVKHNRIPPHRVACYEVGVVDTGDLRLVIAGRDLDLPAGHMIVTPPQTEIASAPGMNAGLLYWIGIDPDLALQNGEQPGGRAAIESLRDRLKSTSMRALPVKPTVIEAADALLHRIRAAGAFPEGSGSIASVGAAWRLVGAVADALAMPGDDPAGEAQRIEPALRLIRTRLSDAPTPDEMARACGMSRATFNAVFRRVVGQTPHAYVNHQRIDKARQLLVASEMSVRDIAAKLGFSNGQYFASVFKRYTGRTPTDYREQPGDV